MSRLRRLERLIRIRRAERDRERMASEARRLAAEHARTRVSQVETSLKHESTAFVEDTQQGATAPWWKAMFSGLDLLGSQLEAARSEADLAGEEEEAALEELRGARQKLRGAERLAERARSDERRVNTRRQQKRLDDRSAFPTKGGRWVLALVCLATASALDARAEDSAPTNPGIEMLVGEIRVRQAELDSRERELADREAHLAELEEEIRARLDELAQITSAVETRIASWEQAHEDKQLSRLSKIYGSMEPRTAARLLEDLELDLATRIIAKMKHKQSAALLPLISQPRALAMSRSVAHPLGNPALPSENK